MVAHYVLPAIAIARRTRRAAALLGLNRAKQTRGTPHRLGRTVVGQHVANRIVWAQLDGGAVARLCHFVPLDCRGLLTVR